MKKTLLTIISAITTCLIFTSCFDPIFSDIRNEVPLKEAQISGFINSIVRYKDDIYLQNGRIYSKPITSTAHGQWALDKSSQITPLEFDYYAQSFYGEYIVKLASDANYIYALSYNFGPKENEGLNEVKDIFVYYKTNSDSDWKKSSGSLQTELTEIAKNYKDLEDKSYEMTDSTKTVAMFCTNTPQEANRHAYIKIGTKLYKLDGAKLASDTALDEITSPAKIHTSESTDNSKIVSAMYINGDVYFSEHIACGTDETATTNAKFGYYAIDKKLYYFEAANVLAKDKNSIELETNNKIISMAISKDSILLGTDESGIKRAILTDGVPAKTNEYVSNSSIILCEPYIIREIFSAYPDKTEAENTMYASMQFRWTETNSGAQYSNTGLWSYYNTTDRNNWNRE